MADPGLLKIEAFEISLASGRDKQVRAAQNVPAKIDKSVCAVAPD